MRPLNDRLGVMQGRLIPSMSGALDCPPGPHWRSEWPIAKSLNLHHIELVAERATDRDNPIWSTSGRAELLALAGETGVLAASLCVNETLGHCIVEPGFARGLANRLGPVVAGLDAPVVVVPLLEASDIADVDLHRAAASARIVAEAIVTHGGVATFELSLPARQAIDFLGLAGPNSSLCYDLGNATAAGYDVPTELHELDSLIGHVHAKDKDTAGQNVKFGCGRVRFDQALHELDRLGYDGLITMEATRGEDPVATAAAHVTYLLERDPHSQRPTVSR